MRSKAAVRITRVFAVVAAAALGTWGSPSAAQTLEPRVSYHLNAALHASPTGRYVIRGSGTLTVVNTSRATLRTLPLHLYMNAFANGSLARSLPFLDSRAALDGSDEGAGSIEVHSVHDQRNNHALALQFDQTTADKTTATVELDLPVGPDESADFMLEWTTLLPALSQRSGSVRSFVFAGQWFPKLAKLERDGSWTQFVFHPQAEFYANFGDYDVTLDTPLDQVVGASGVLHSQTCDAVRCLSRYVATDVHDFAWTAWPEFASHDFTVDDTRVRVLFPPGHERNRDVTVATIAKALPWLESWLGEYAVPTLTVVHPPEFARAAGGMEYPGLITTGGARLTSLVSDEVERVVVHELAHQWFYGSVASNEYAWPFLDEGLTMYAENRAMQELYSGTRADFLRFQTTFGQYTSAYRARHDAAVSASAASFTSFGQLAALAYDRAALVLETFARSYGPRFDVALGQYTRVYQQHHPSPDDLLRVIESHVGVAAGDNLRTALLDRGWVNYRVTSLEHVNDPNNPRSVLNRVVVTRQGPLQLPVWVTVTDSDGNVQRERWDDTSPRREFQFTKAAPLREVCVDPDRDVLIDDDPSDNCKRSTQPTVPPYWLQLLLAFQGLLSWWSW